MRAVLSAPRLEAVPRAKVAVALVFALNGLAFASWAARVPGVRATLDLSAGGLGLLLLCVSGGALVALPTSGALVSRVGAARTVVGGVVAVVAGLLVTAAGLATGALPLVAVGLSVLGLGTSTWDVAMNVEAADVERAVGRTLMPRFHAGFSLGTVVGAAAGATAAALGVPLEVQLLLTAPVVLVPGIAATRAFLLPAPAPAAGAAPRPSALAAWGEPRTLLLGLMVLAFALCEGIANDWLAVALVDGYRASEALGAVAFGVFVAAMTLGRLVGGAVVDRVGRVPALRATAVLIAVGAVTVMASPGLVGAYAGAALWGIGASLGFPLGMSAAADQPERAAVRVSVVGSIGYTAFLGGPPLVGVLADRAGIRRALLVALVAALVGLVTAGASRREC